LLPNDEISRFSSKLTIATSKDFSSTTVERREMQTDKSAFADFLKVFIVAIPISAKGFLLRNPIHENEKATIAKTKAKATLIKIHFLTLLLFLGFFVSSYSIYVSSATAGWKSIIYSKQQD
jgi:hypothetical protein